MNNKSPLSFQATYHPLFFNVWFGQKVTITASLEDTFRIETLEVGRPPLLDVSFADISKVYKYSPGLVVVYSNKGAFKIDFQPRAKKSLSFLIGGWYTWAASTRNNPWVPANDLVERFESSGVKIVRNRSMMAVVVGALVGVIVTFGIIFLIFWLISLNSK